MHLDNRIPTTGVYTPCHPSYNTIEQNRAEVTAIQANAAPIMAAARAYAMTSTEIPDASALEMAPLFPIWEEVLRSGTELAAGRVISSGGQLYRVVQANVPQAHQVPGREGMLAVYRPIDREHAGTLEDPYPMGVWHGLSGRDVLQLRGRCLPGGGWRGYVKNFCQR